jgi:hypothetical protein
MCLDCQNCSGVSKISKVSSYVLCVGQYGAKQFRLGHVYATALATRARKS